MEYARLEMRLVRSGWSRGMAFAGALSGPVTGAVVSSPSWQVLRTLLRRKDVRKSERQPTSTPASPASGPTPTGSSILTLKSSVVGPQGAIGTLSRLWVSRADACVTHVLVQVSGGNEHIVPVNLVETLRGSRVILKINKDAVRRLFLYRPDAQLESEVRLAIDATLANPRARRDVKVHVSDGDASLAGELDTIEQMRQAEQAARSVPGVRSITNDLVVQESLAASVESQIADALREQTGNAGIRVLAEHGIVHLEGTVATPEVKSHAERVAIAAVGVKVVVNQLRVLGEPPDRANGTGPLVRNR